MEEKILKILETQPNLSNREIGKIVGLSRSGVLRYMNKLNIHRDRKMMLRLNNTCREKKLKITENAELIILGSILGDGCVYAHRRPKNTKELLNSYLSIIHGIKLKDYIEYKKDLLEKEGIKCYLKFFDGSKFKEHYIRGNLVVENGRYLLKTQRNVVFNKYRDMFYRKNRPKTINKILYKLTALGLAIWYLDDGSKKGNSYTFSTNGFSWKDAKFLLRLLFHNFNIETSLLKSSINLPIIYILQKSVIDFENLIIPYIPTSMLYKIHKRNDT